jgi:integrase
MHQRLDRHSAGRAAPRVARHAGITKPVGPHTLRHAFITAAQMASTGRGCDACRPRLLQPAHPAKPQVTALCQVL